MYMEEQQPIRAVLLAASLGRTAGDCENSLGELERLLELFDSLKL